MTTLKKVRIKNPIPKYYPDDVVYAISFNNEDTSNSKTTTDEWDMNYARIYKVIVIDVSIAKDGIRYYLQDFKDKEEWGDSVPDVNVNKDINVLLQFLINKWKI